MSPVKVSRALLIEGPNAVDADVPAPSGLSGPRRVTYIALGCAFVALAIVGVAVPGLPSTPFLLLASHFWLRSSPALHARLLRSRVLGTLLLDWQQHRGLSWRTKTTAIILVLIATSSSIACGGVSPTCRAIILLAATSGVIVVLYLPVVQRVQPHDDRAAKRISSLDSPRTRTCNRKAVRIPSPENSVH